MNQQPYKLIEGLEENALVDRVEDTIYFDQYSAKMGNDDEMVVASFKVFGQQPAFQLENFLEKGYNWIVDAETSPGQISDGNYLVFVEAKRRTDYPKKFMDLLDDIKNITGPKDWKMVYFDHNLKETEREAQPLTLETLTKSVPLSPRAYREVKSTNNVLESMLNSAGVPRTKGDIDGFKPFKRRARN